MSNSPDNDDVYVSMGKEEVEHSEQDPLDINFATIAFQKVRPYKRTKDEHGDSRLVTFRIAPPIWELGKHIVEKWGKTRGINYGSQSDLGRDAYFRLVSGLYRSYGEDIEPGLGTVQAEAEFQDRLNAMVEQDRLTKQINSLDDALSEHLRHNDTVMVYEWLEKWVETIERWESRARTLTGRWKEKLVTSQTIMRALRMLEADERYSDSHEVLKLEQWYSEYQQRPGLPITSAGNYIMARAAGRNN